MELTPCLALDCEMVRVGTNWRQDALARVSIVNEHMECVYDKYVRPARPVTNYRTHISGIKPGDLENAENFETVQREVKEMIAGRILIGHGLDSDFSALKFTHPEELVRDTSFYFERINNNRTPALKWLAQRFLGLEVQTGEHCSVEDAETCMKIYRAHAVRWEHDVARNALRNQ